MQILTLRYVLNVQNSCIHVFVPLVPNTICFCSYVFAGL